MMLTLGVPSRTLHLSRLRIKSIGPNSLTGSLLAWCVVPPSAPQSVCAWRQTMANQKPHHSAKKKSSERALIYGAGLRLPIFFVELFPPSNQPNTQRDNEVAISFREISIHITKLRREFPRCLRPSLSCKRPLRDMPWFLQACPAVQQPQRAVSIPLDEVYPGFRCLKPFSFFWKREGFELDIVLSSFGGKPDSEASKICSS